MVPDEFELPILSKGTIMKLDENFTDFIRVSEYNWSIKIALALGISNALKNLQCYLWLIQHKQLFFVVVLELDSGL